MPRRRQYKRKPRRYRKKWRAQGVPPGMPLQRRAMLRFCDIRDVVVPGSGASQGFTNINYSCVNAYDPNPDNLPLGQHQPLGYDQWETLYNHFVVVGAKISARVVSMDSAIQGICGIHLNDVAAAPYQKAETYIESRKGTYRHIIQRTDRPVQISSSYSARKFFNIKDIKDNQARLARFCASGNTLGNTNETAYWNLWFTNQNNEVSTYKVEIVIDYIIDFSEPRDLTESS